MRVFEATFLAEDHLRKERIDMNQVHIDNVSMIYRSLVQLG